MKATMRALAYAALFLCACDSQEPNLYGNQRIQGATLADCSPYGETNLHTCLLLTDSLAGQMRVFDATAKRYVLGPTGYAPLVVPLNKSVDEKGLVEQVVSQKGISFAYALDRKNSRILIVRTQPSQAEKTTFGKPGEFVWQDKKIGALALAIARPANATKPFLFVATNTGGQESQIQSFSIDESTGSLTQDPGRSISLPGNVTEMVVDDQSKTLVTLSDSKAYVFNLDETGGILNRKDVPVEGIRKVAVQADKIAIAHFEADAWKMSLFTGDSLTKQGSVTLSALPLGVYLSSVNSQACNPDKPTQYATVALSNSKLEFLLLNQINGEDTKIDDARCIPAVDLKANQKIGPQTLVNNLAYVISGEISADGSEPPSCKRQTFLLFSTGLAAYTCEGKQEYVRF